MGKPLIYDYPKNFTITYDEETAPVVVSGAISPVGSFLGALAKIPSTILNDVVTKNALLRAGLNFKDGIISKEDADKLDLIITANIMGLERGHGRQTAHRLGFVNIAGENSEKMCISGLKAINDALLLLTHKNSPYSRVIASGTESLSRIPHSVQIRGKSLQELPGVDKKGRPNVLKTFYGHLTLSNKYPIISDLVFNDEAMNGLTCPLSELIMGKTAERLAKYFEITKDEVDNFALDSHLNAGAAGILGTYDNLITQIPGTNLLYHEGIRTDKIHLDEIAENKKFVFSFPEIEKPVVTPANACPLNDGSAALYLVKKELAREHKDPIGTILAYSNVAVDPSIMGIGPAPAIHFLVEKAEEEFLIKFDEIGIVNINEAFSAQVLACKKDLRERYKKDIDGKLNLDGGSIAVGHPVGSTLVRIVLETFCMLRERNIKYGIASACVGHGMGGAMLLANPYFDKTKPGDLRQAKVRAQERFNADIYNILRRLSVYGKP